jgi:hypothetical protein
VSKGKCPKCPSSDAYETYEDGHSHCYSCSYHEHGTLSLAALKNSLTVGKEKGPSGVSLPEDFDYYLPPYAGDWLLKYRITQTEKQKNSIGYSATYESMVFPVFGEDRTKLEMYQRRYFGDDPDIPKWVTKGTKGDVLHLSNHHEHDIIVLVEDIVSAIKVSRVTNCAPIFGSNLSEAMARRIVKLFGKARVWLDPDKKLHSLKTSLLLTELGCPSTVIFTSKDPKEYGTADIRQLVNLGD